VCISDNLERNRKSEKKHEKEIAKNNHIDSAKLSTPQANEEIERAALARAISPEAIEYAKRHMQENLKINNRASYLASMLDGIAKGTWSIGSSLKKVDDPKGVNYTGHVNCIGDTDMTLPTYESRIQHQKICIEAEEMAVRALKGRGIIDPALMLDGKLPTYDEIERYRDLVADEMHRNVMILCTRFSKASNDNKTINPGVNYYE
jgi:hypothetical protein